MRIPLTGYGWPQVAIYPVILLLLMVLVAVFGPAQLPTPAWLGLELALLLIFGWALSFFRDPERISPPDPNLLISPADGRITDIDTIDDTSISEGPILRIGIFLSIFNVHINRTPCRCRLESTKYKAGQYKNALNPESSRVNESNTLRLTRLDAPQDPLAVKQISGAIARHIVCRVHEGQELAVGEAFGMIKFGSRTELYVPARENLSTEVAIGDKVQAGITILARYQA